MNKDTLPGSVRLLAHIMRTHAWTYRELGINPAQLSALTIIDGVDEISQSSLVHELRVSASTVSEILMALERKGFITKDFLPDTKKGFFIQITARGEALLKRIASMPDPLEAALRKMSADDQAAYHRLTSSILAEFGVSA